MLMFLSQNFQNPQNSFLQGKSPTGSFPAARQLPSRTHDDLSFALFCGFCV
jgi:hypothetical protein